MAESSIFTSWGIPVPGRETKGLELFQEVVGFWIKQKAAGVIEDFRVGLATQGNYDALSGYLVVEGSKKAISEALESAEFRSQITRALHIVQNLSTVRCDTGTAIPGRIEEIVTARKQLGII